VLAAKSSFIGIEYIPRLKFALPAGMDSTDGSVVPNRATVSSLKSPTLQNLRGLNAGQAAPVDQIDDEAANLHFGALGRKLPVHDPKAVGRDRPTIVRRYRLRSFHRPEHFEALQCGDHEGLRAAQSLRNLSRRKCVFCVKIGDLRLVQGLRKSLELNDFSKIAGVRSVFSPINHSSL